MVSARGGHTATLLTDGRVLVVGGARNPETLRWNDAGVAESEGIELVDPHGQDHGALYSLAWRTVGHTATLLTDGRVVLIGGREDATTWRGTRLFDPHTDRWEFPAGPSALRAEHTATLLADGSVLVVGGAQPTADVAARQRTWRFDPTTHAWRPAAVLPVVLEGHTATRLADGRVLLAGGTTEAIALVYDATHDRFATLRASPRVGHTATLLADGRVLLAGGVLRPGAPTLAPMELFDPRVDRTVPGPALATPRSAHSATRLADGRVLVAGGVDAAGATLASAEVFTGDAWCGTEPMVSPRAYHAALALPDGRVMVLGGADRGDTALDRYVRTSAFYVVGP